MPGPLEDPNAMPPASSLISTSLGTGEPHRQLPGKLTRRPNVRTKQLPFEWAALRPSPRLPPAVAIPKARQPASQQLPSNPPVSPNLPKPNLRVVVERHLRSEHIPYISVDEAKKALFAGAKLGAFHFVIYRPSGKNWLVWAAQLRKESRQNMLDWERIFGEGFMAVVAKQKADGKIAFQCLNGEALILR